MFLNFVVIAQDERGGFVFFDIFSMLCERVGKKPSAVAAALGINKSNVSNWKKSGYIPRGNALSQIAQYFGVTADYLLGNSIDAQIDVTDYRLRIASAQYAVEEDDMRREELANKVDILRESLADLRLSAALSDVEQKNKPVGMTNEQLKFALFGETDVIDDADLEDVKRYAAFVRERKEQKNGAV